MRNIVAMLAAGLTVSACTTMDARGEPDTKSATAVLRAADGSEHGRAVVTMVGEAMRLTVNVTGQAPGEHGMHVHAIGRCDAPDFASAGPHLNLGAKQHGRANPMGAHEGDLPNIVIGANREGSITADLPGGLIGLLDADGSAVIVHAAADDYRTDPSGNSGARVLCGVFSPTS